MIKADWFNINEKRAAYGDGFVEKVFSGSDIDLTVDKNEIVTTVSSDKIDASGEIVLPKGIDLTRFKKQPAVYFEHNMDGLPLGPCLWIKTRSKDVVAKWKIIEEASEQHRAISILMRNGVYNSYSIGFLSDSPSKPTPQELRFHPEYAGAKSIHRKTNLLEFSLVGLPCNDDAVAMAIGKSFQKSIVDRLTGRTAATEQATSEVIEQVKKSEVKTAADIRKEIFKGIEQQVKNIDRDLVLKNALKAFRK